MRFPTRYQNSRKPNYYWYDVIIETAANNKLEINIAVLSQEEYNQLCEGDSIDLYLKQTEDAAKFFLKNQRNNSSQNFIIVLHYTIKLNYVFKK